MHDAAWLMDLYGCAGRPQGWPRMLDRLCADTQAQSAVLQAFALEHGAVRVLWQTTDTRTAQRPMDMGRLSGRDNPRIDRARMLRVVDRVVRDDDLFEPGEAAHTSLQDQLAHARLGRFMGLLRSQPEGRLLGIALHRAAGDTTDFGGAVADKLQSLAPHLGQAWELGWQMRTAESEAQCMRSHMDALQVGVLVCNDQGRVQWMNRSAHSILDEGGSLTMRGGELHALMPTQSAALRNAIAAAANACDAATRYVAIAAAGGALHLAVRAHRDAVHGAPGVIIAVTCARSVVRVPVQAWSSLLGVTAAEASLVAALVRGCTVEEHAALRGISIGTARNQLKQALAKTETTRQVDLVRLALGSAAAQVLDGIPCPSHESQKAQAARIATCVP